MKKIALTVAIVLGMSVASFAQDDSRSGLFNRLGIYESTDGDPESLVLPYEHGLTDDTDAPLGSGIAVLAGLGVAYLVGKKRKED